MKASHRFTAKLLRPEGARVFKGTMSGCPDLRSSMMVLRELLCANDAFKTSVTSIKISISPIRRKTKS